MMNRFNALRFSASKPLQRTAIAGLFSAVSVLSGIVSADVAHAQQPPGDLNLYTKVARQIEQQRLRYYSEVKQIMNGNVPDDVCLQRNLTPQVQEVCKRFNENVYTILGSNNMDRDQFKRLKNYCDQSPKPGQCP